MNLFDSFRAAINPTLNARHPSPARFSHQDSWCRASSMIANDSPRKLNRAVAMAVVLVCMAVAPVLAGEMKWTGGANDGKWENKDNWEPKGPPTENDDVVIPKNSKTITTDGTEKKVNSLKVEDSDPALEPQFPRTKITADGSGKSVKITAKGDKGISIGKNDEVHGADGKDGKADPGGNDTEDGGDVRLDAPDGKVTNKGDIKGGNGGNGDGLGSKKDQRKGGKGGAVVVDGKEIDNSGKEKGGDGGNGSGQKAPGGEGGDVRNDSETEDNRPGNKTGGTGGKGSGGARKKEKDGKVYSLAPLRIFFDFDFFSFVGQRGDSIVIQTGPEGSINMTGLGASAFVAEDTVTIDAGGPDNVIDLRGIPAGTKVIAAGSHVALRGAVLLDPGVRLEDIIDTDLIVLLPAHGGSVPPGAQLIQLGRNQAGSLDSEAVGGFTLNGGGNDAWDNMDECTFASREVGGDFDLQVRVEYLEPNSRWTKAGLMVRENLSESGRMAFNRVTPQAVPTSDGDIGANDSRFAYRTGRDETELGGGRNGGRHEDGEGVNHGSNTWLRVVRAGSVLSGYRSEDGVNWVLQGSQDTTLWAGGAFGLSVHVGVAVSRGPGGNLTARAEFRNYQITLRPTASPLRLLSASSEGQRNGIKIQFGKLMRDDGTDLWHWAISPGTVSNAQFGASADLVQLTTSPLVEGRTYTLTIGGIRARDTGELLTPDPTTISFVHGAGYEARRIRLERWNFIPGGSVEPILQSQAYARDLPDVVYSNTLFEDTTPGSNDFFSGRIFGVLNITNTGDYRFFACSDDSSQLFLSTDDQPANKVEIAREPEWNGPRQYATLDRRGPGRANASAPIRLEAGRRYFIEQVFADGNQGNNASVAWQPPGTAEPGNGATPIPQTAFIPARYFKGTIFYTLGPPRILTQPASQTVSNGQTATFVVRVDGTPPYSYQWQRRDSFSARFEDLPEATGATYSTPAGLLDNGAQFRCVVANGFATTTSVAATLTVTGCSLVITRQPADAAVIAGQSATFAVEAWALEGPFTYQWQAGPGSDPFTNIPPATSSTLTLTAGMMDNGSQWRCIVGNGCQVVTSAVARLTVLPPPPARDFATQGLSLTPLANGLYEAVPQLGISLGAGATNPVPLDFVVLVNGSMRFDGRNLNSVGREATDSCPSECTGGCVGFLGSKSWEGDCRGGSGGCNCVATASLDAIPLALSPGDVVQLVLDPDSRVPESDEANNSFFAVVPAPPMPQHDFAAQGLDLNFVGSGIYEVRPLAGISIGPNATNPVPLDFVVLVNGTTHHDGRGAQTVSLWAPCDDMDNCTGGCWVAVNGQRRIGTCPGQCYCKVTSELSVLQLALSPGDVLQLVLDPDHRVNELDEANNVVRTVIRERPRLAIEPARTGVNVSWAAAASNHVLQVALEVTEPMVWVNETRQPGLVGGRYQLAYPLEGSARFFRLAPSHLAAPVPLTASGASEILRHGLEVLLAREPQPHLRAQFGSQTLMVVDRLAARDLAGAAGALENLTAFVEANATSPLSRAIFANLVSHVANNLAAGTLVGILSNDTDGDGMTNLADDDIDGDDLKNGDPFEDDIDGDGKKNSEDDDMDGDGGANGSDMDMDNDGKPNSNDDDIDADGKANQGPARKPLPGGGDDADDDIDGDGVLDETDYDIDGDGLLNDVDSDMDGDGVPNNDPLEDDKDGDGELNGNDNQPGGNTKPHPPGGQHPDRDGDGVPDGMDDDVDGDGKLNKADDDVDGDGKPNGQDDDIDGDGKGNSADDDVDGDGLPNAVDLDVDGDGITNADDRDIDGDGIPNDQDPDMDGDGVANGADDDMDGDDLKNGETDPDIDGDGTPNDMDRDVDGDGTANLDDNDVDGDRVANDQDTDDDGDGTRDDLDRTPQGP